MGEAAKAEPKQSASEKAKVEFEVEVPGDWIDFVTLWSDGFSYSYYGYWARGAEHFEGLGWLVWEDDEKCKHTDEPDRDKAILAFQKGEPLPPRWFRFDRAFAIRAYIEGVKRWGLDWYTTKGDANTYDVVVQLAALGEIRYG